MKGENFMFKFQRSLAAEEGSSSLSHRKSFLSIFLIDDHVVQCDITHHFLMSFMP